MLAKRRGRPWHASPRPHDHPEFVDEAFDDGADDAIALLRYEIHTYGAAPLHPDGDRITTYDPVPLHGDDGRHRKPEGKPLKAPKRPKTWKGPTEDESRAAEKMVAWLASRPVTIDESQAVNRPSRLPPKPPRLDRKNLGHPPIVEWLPADFQWMLDGDHSISQAEVEQFWIDHRSRIFAFRTVRV